MVTLATQAWSAAGHAVEPLTHPFFQVAPWAFGGIVALGLARAFLVRRRYRAVDALDLAAEERVRRAIADAERATSADIVPLVVERSDPQSHTLLAGALLFLAVANAALLAWLGQLGFGLQALAELALAAAGFAFTWFVPDYRRLFLSRARADESAGEQAIVELARLAPGAPQPTPVVLLFVSLFEHRVVVLGSEPTAGALKPEQWPAVVDAVLAPVRRGRLADGLVAGLERCAREMQRSFPAEGDPPRRFADRAIVRRK